MHVSGQYNIYQGANRNEIVSDYSGNTEGLL